MFIQSNDCIHVNALSLALESRVEYWTETLFAETVSPPKANHELHPFQQVLITRLTTQILPSWINFEKDHLRIMLLEAALQPGEGFSQLVETLYGIAM